MMEAGVTRAKLEAVVEAGILAPSADNHHLVQFELLDRGIRIWGNAEFEKTPFHRRVLCLIGFGAVVENMSLRATRLGLTTEIDWFPDPERPALIAEIRVRAGAGGAEDLEAAIPMRHTNRAFFRGPPMPENQRRSLEADVARIPGVRLFWFDEPSLRKGVLSLLRTAESERFRSSPLHAELFSSIRFDVGWGAPASQGLAPGALGIEAPLRPAFAALRHWPLMRFLNAFGLHHLIGMRAGDAPCRFAPHVCALATTLSLDYGCTAVGQALERVWLRTSVFGLAFQPFAAPTLLALDRSLGVSTPVRAKLAKGWAKLVPGVTPLIVFRIGRASPPAVRSGRGSVQQYIL